MKHSNFCKNIKEIENYEQAAADNFIGWIIHHRLETHNSDGVRRLINLSRNELIALNMYYDRPASELIFMRNKDHMSLHNKGKITSENTKIKMSTSHKGMLFSEEHCLNLSKSKIGYNAPNGKNITIYVKDENSIISKFTYSSEVKAAEGLSRSIGKKVGRNYIAGHLNKEFKINNFYYLIELTNY